MYLLGDRNLSQFVFLPWINWVQAWVSNRELLIFRLTSSVFIISAWPMTISLDNNNKSVQIVPTHNYRIQVFTIGPFVVFVLYSLLICGLLWCNQIVTASLAPQILLQSSQISLSVQSSHVWVLKMVSYGRILYCEFKCQLWLIQLLLVLWQLGGTLLYFLYVLVL